MNDHDEAHLMDGEETPEDYVLYQHDQVMKLLAGWKRNNSFMFVKRRDEEDWAELVDKIGEVLQS